MSNKAKLRLNNELYAMLKDASFKIILEKDDDLFKWIILLPGPEASPYEGGIFKISFEFPETYPFREPTVKFVTPIYHPNVHNSGYMCKAVNNNWTPLNKAEEVIEKIYSLMFEPNLEDVFEYDIGKVFEKDRDGFNKTAREWTLKYAI